MASSLEEQRAAAAVRPSQRTPEDARRVAEGSGDQSVRNAAHRAAYEERVYGSKPAK